MFHGYYIGDAHSHPLLFSKYLPGKSFAPDLHKIREEGVDFLTFTIYVPFTFPFKNFMDGVKKETALFQEILNRHSDIAEHACSADHAKEIIGRNRIALFLAVEGGHSIDRNLKNLEFLKKNHIIYMTIVHFVDNEIGGSVRGKGTGLTDFGRDLIQAMDESGIRIDLAHSSKKTFHDVLKISRKPPAVTHTGILKLCRHERNITDVQAKAIIERNGFIGLIFFPWYHEDHNYSGKIENIMKAVSHIADLGGEKHVGIGSDTIAMIEKLCRFKNYDNFSQIAAYFEEKLGKKTARGFMGKNFLDYLAR